jgi:4-hydroxybenzoate polyprenyltransferase
MAKSNSNPGYHPFGTDVEQPNTVSPLNELGEGTLQRPLCVNLDGALVRTDIFWEGVLQLVRQRPGLILVLLVWMLEGRARFRRAVVARVAFDPAALPYRTDVLEMLRVCAGEGRRVVLWSTSDVRLVEAVAKHLALFHEVVASGENIERARRRESFEARFGSTGFDYIGDSAADLPILAAAHRGYLVGASRSLARRARLLGEKAQVLSTRPSRMKAMAKVMRPHQLAKNALVVVPLLLAPGLPSFGRLASAALAAIAFSLCASAGYVFNDLVDVVADREHRTKRLRPFASGDLPLFYGPPLFLALFSASFGLALATLPVGFLGMLAVYFVATLAYSFVLKSKLMVDVVVLAWLYTHRVLAGGIATGIAISAWLLAFSMFMFLSLAFAKRYIELRQSMTRGGQLKSRGYHTQDLEMVASMGPTAGYVAVLVFCLYIDSNAVTERYRAPMALWFVAPMLLYWISRVWFLAHRGHMQDDPVRFALTDRLSWLCAVLVALVAAAARFWPR